MDEEAREEVPMTLSIVITRKDGTVEDLGVVAANTDHEWSVDKK